MGERIIELLKCLLRDETPTVLCERAIVCLTSIFGCWVAEMLCDSLIHLLCDLSVTGSETAVRSFTSIFQHLEPGMVTTIVHDTPIIDSLASFLSDDVLRESAVICLNTIFQRLEPRLIPEFVAEKPIVDSLTSFLLDDLPFLLRELAVLCLISIFQRVEVNEMARILRERSVFAAIFDQGACNLLAHMGQLGICVMLFVLKCKAINDGEDTSCRALTAGLTDLLDAVSPNPTPDEVRAFSDDLMDVPIFQQWIMT
jgi:hypothetical protein